jgi:hypothetical protein
MRALKSVLGVSAECWVCFQNPTQDVGPKSVACRQVCRVCWVYARAGVYAPIIFSNSREINFSHANPEKPYKPNTLNTTSIKGLFLKCLLCVGFVLGMGFLCWVDVLSGVW